MNKAVVLIKRLKTFQSRGRVLSQFYCTDKPEDTSNEKKNVPGEKLESGKTFETDDAVRVKKTNFKTVEPVKGGKLFAAGKVHGVDEKSGKDDPGDDSDSSSSDSDEAPSVHVKKTKSFETSEMKRRHESQAKESPDEAGVGASGEQNANPEESSPDKVKEYGGFLRSFNKMEKLRQEPEQTERRKPKKYGYTFAKLFRESSFVDLGDPVGKKVVGQIFHVVDDDLYIDFGWKFYTVCKRPQKDAKFYVPGIKVILIIKDLELCTTFLGDKSYTTLLEADCDLLGIFKIREKGAKKEVEVQSEIESEDMEEWRGEMEK